MDRPDPAIAKIVGGRWDFRPAAITHHTTRREATMAKLRLDMEDLAVQSFDTSAKLDTRRGTVQGHATFGQDTCIGPTCRRCPPSDGGTCGATCVNTCVNTCDDATCATCAASCAATCYYTCDDASCDTCRTDCFGICTGGGGTTVP
jgi:hypothetical protein